MAVSRVKVWSAGEVLTASDLNAEFNNVISNGQDLGSPRTKALDMDGQQIVLDADADSYLVEHADDVIKLRLQGVDLFYWDGDATSPVNGLTFTASAAGSGVTIGATGSDTNINLILAPKGAGLIDTDDSHILVDTGKGIVDENSNEQLLFSTTASAINNFQVANAAMGNAPVLSAVGGDTNIDLILTPKGTGTVKPTGPIDSNGKAIDFSEGSSVAAGSSANIWVTDGNTLHLTGTGTVDTFANAPRIGSSRWLVADAASTITHGSGITVPGSANYTCAAGDIIYVYADAVDAFRIAIIRSNGYAIDSAVPRSYLAGATLSNNSTDSTNDIDIAAGLCRDSTDAVNIDIAAMTKRLDAGWAAGTGNGMRNSAAAITDTTYFIYAVATADGTQDFYAHTSATVSTVLTALQAETGGSSYIYARRIGAILRESSTIVPFTQYGDYFQRTAISSDISSNNPGTSAVTRALLVPIGIVVEADVLLNVNSGGVATSACLALLTALNTTDQAPSNTLSQTATQVSGAGGASYSWAQVRVFTNTSGQIRSRISFSDGNITLLIKTRGWIDRRGRDD